LVLSCFGLRATLASEERGPSTQGKENLQFRKDNGHGFLVSFAVFSGRGFAQRPKLQLRLFFEHNSCHTCTETAIRSATVAIEARRNSHGQRVPAPIKKDPFFLEKFRFSSAPHPPFSPDLAPSGFYLFGKIKKKLEGRRFRNSDELLDAIIYITAFIPASELQAVFQEWEMRLRKCIELNGEYVD